MPSLNMSKAKPTFAFVLNRLFWPFTIESQNISDSFIVWPTSVQ
jgi:hypothetical protein